MEMDNQQEWLSMIILSKDLHSDFKDKFDNWKWMIEGQFENKTVYFPISKKFVGERFLNTDEKDRLSFITQDICKTGLKFERVVFPIQNELQINWKTINEKGQTQWKRQKLTAEQKRQFFSENHKDTMHFAAKYLKSLSEK